MKKAILIQILFIAITLVLGYCLLIVGFTMAWTTCEASMDCGGWNIFWGGFPIFNILATVWFYSLFNKLRYKRLYTKGALKLSTKLKVWSRIFVFFSYGLIVYTLGTLGWPFIVNLILIPMFDGR